MFKKITIILFLFSLCLSEGIIASEWTPLTKLREKTFSYFVSLEGRIISIDKNGVLIDIGKRNRANVGMRLKVFRQAVPFYHPVTGELIGNTDVPGGIIEIIETGESTSRCRVISGQPNKGNIVRSLGEKIRALFYQDESVDYFLGDAYYKELKKSGLVALVDAPIEPMNRQQLLKLAEEKGTDVIIAISSETEGDIVLKQTLMWRDGTIISIDKVRIPREMLAELRKGSEFLIGHQNEALLTFNLPSDTENIVITDIDGDQNLELIFSTSTDIYLYRYDIELDFKGRVKGKPTEEIIWLDTIDLEPDGRKELIVSTISDERDRVSSYVYRITIDNSNEKPFKLEKLWQTEGFIRVFNNKLIYQKYSPFEGYTGPIRRIFYTNGNFLIKDVIKELPSMVNIYDFGKIKDSDGNLYYLYIDDEAYLNLINKDGLIIWKDNGNLGGFRKSFEKESFSVILEEEKWHVKDRIITKENHAFVVKKYPLVEQAKTIGYRKSQLLLVWTSSGIIQQSVIIDDISGELLDYAVFDNKVAILSKPLFGLKAENILKGENPFGTYLQIYSIKGG